MSFFIRKSKKFGLFNLNFSKSGIGISFGVKGCRISLGSKGVQFNAGKNGVYYRKSLNGKKKNKKQDISEITTETIINEQQEIEQKEITKSPEQETFEFLLSLFTGGFLIAFVCLFFKFWLACLFGIILIFGRKQFIKRNPDKYKIYQENPEPQLYYLGKTKKQIEELKIKAEELKQSKIKERQAQNNEKKYQEYNYSHKTKKGNIYGN